MIEITDSIEKKIQELVNKGMRNKLEIFNVIIENDKQLNEIILLYKKGKSIEDIAIQNKIPLEEVRKSIEVSIEIFSLIDRNIRLLYSKSYLEKMVIKNNLPHKTDKEMKESIRLIRNKQFSESVRRSKEKLYGSKCEIDDKEL